MRYWVYLNGEVPGSYAPEELAAIPGFGDASMVCPAEGEIQERNWRHAAEFADIAGALSARRLSSPLPASAPAPAEESSFPKTPDDILNDSSSRIFSHVTELMKELENRREERALSQALRRQVVEVKNELLAARERIRFLESRAALIPGFEDRERVLHEQLAKARGDLLELQEKFTAAQEGLKRRREELEEAASRIESQESDLSRKKTVVEELSRQLAEKELTLARSFGIIRKLESMLGDILPGSASGLRPMEEALGPAERGLEIPSTGPGAHPPSRIGDGPAPVEGPAPAEPSLSPSPAQAAEEARRCGRPDRMET